MSLEADLKANLTQAMRDKDRRTADVIRMINTRIMEKRTAKGFSGQVDDAMVQDVIAAYRKSMQKARTEYENLGERGAEEVAKLDWEIQYLEKYLPAGLSEDQLRAAVKQAITELGVSDPKQAGRVVGHVMKSHKGQAEAADVKRVAEAELQSST